MATTENPGCLPSILSKIFGTKQFDTTSSYIDAESISIETTASPPYRLRDQFLSPAELSFYFVLSNDVLQNNYAVFSKVRLADLFYVVRSNKNRSAFPRISQKHVDFVICDPNTLQPICAVELDDSSHQNSARIERDAFVDEVFKVVGLPLVHITALYSYDIEEVMAQITPFLKEQTNTVKPFSSAIPIEGQFSSPVCSECGSKMTLRIAKKGANAGNRFWGCLNYPACQNTLEHEG